MNLFVREPESLEGYTPEFSQEETLLGYAYEKYEVGGGFKDFDYDRENPKYAERWSIQPLGVLITGQYNFYQGDKFDVAAKIANEFLKDAGCRIKNPEVWNYLNTNATGLTNSKRYWKARNHRERIDEKIAERDALTTMITRAEIVHSMFAAEVKDQRNYTREEKDRALTEFNGEEWKNED